MIDKSRPARDEILALKGKTIRVCDLLAKFGVRMRNHHTVNLIAEALLDAELGTQPNFATCSLTAEILVLAAASAPQPDQAGGELPSGALPQHSFKIGDIPSARGGVDSVLSTDPLNAATTIMKLKNYSQIPVIDGISDLKGVVTWSSVAACFEKNSTSLDAAMVKDSLPVAETHQNLFAHLPTVAEHGYVLIRTNTGSFEGIVTASDVAERFHGIAQPFFLVGEIEFRLRKCLRLLSGDAVKNIQPSHRKTGDLADLMFGDYVKLLDGNQHSPQLRAQADSNWQTLGWTSVARIPFVHQLNQVRLIRNGIAHFDEEPPGEEQLDTLRRFAGLLKQLP